MTNNPLFDTILASGDITKRANSQVMDWTTTKSKVLTELKKRQAQSGYSCDMIFIDDITDENMYLSAETIETAMKSVEDRTAQFRSQHLFKLPKNAITGSISGSVLFNEAELTNAKTWSKKHE